MKLNTPDPVIVVSFPESVFIECTSPCGMLEWTYNLEENHRDVAVIEESNQQVCSNGVCKDGHILICPTNRSSNTTIKYSLRLQPLKDFVLQCSVQILTEGDQTIYTLYSQAVLIHVMRTGNNNLSKLVNIMIS